MTETIVAAAVFVDGLIISKPVPARHHHLIHDALFGGVFITPDMQGFLTNTGRFVGRKEALHIATTAEQPFTIHKVRGLDELFSEDLW